LHDEALLPGGPAGEVLGDGDAIGVAEDLDRSAAAVGLSGKRFLAGVSISSRETAVNACDRGPES